MGLRALLLGLAVGCAVAQTAAAAERNRCLTPDERRAVLAARKAVPLARALHEVKARVAGEVVKARLCRQDKGLVYVLTVLARSGKVVQARVDAADGNWLGGS
ncbi:MAG TPA: hypothetical protein VJT13_10060 [Xanthobacteraceae bacterium]|nr:hypothetical protein [Xanthobacteraceae bacterium]